GSPLRSRRRRPDCDRPAPPHSLAPRTAAPSRARCPNSPRSRTLFCRLLHPSPFLPSAAQSEKLGMPPRARPTSSVERSPPPFQRSCPRWPIAMDLADAARLASSDSNKGAPMPDAEPPSTIPRQFAAVVAARGACDAVATIAETVTYAELDRR